MVFFTLIELLIVIAIIAILAAMLLPARTDPAHSRVGHLEAGKLPLGGGEGQISIVAKIGTVKTPGFLMDIAKDKLLAIRVLSMFWLLQEPQKDQVFNVKYFCNNAYHLTVNPSGVTAALLYAGPNRFPRNEAPEATLHLVARNPGNAVVNIAGGGKTSRWEGAFDAGENILRISFSGTTLAEGENPVRIQLAADGRPLLDQTLTLTVENPGKATAELEQNRRIGKEKAERLRTLIAAQKFFPAWFGTLYPEAKVPRVNGFLEFDPDHPKVREFLTQAMGGRSVATRKRMPNGSARYSTSIFTTNSDSTVIRFSE